MKQRNSRLVRLFAALLATASIQALASTPPVVTVPRLTHPGAGQVFYFVLTDRFANGSEANNTGGIPGGRDDHGFDPTAISHYHGGDFVGMTGKLDYLKNLGVTSIWITPPFVNKPVQDVSAGYHGYWILDFTKIDPHLGTDAEFRQFVAQAHARGIRVYLDIVANHTADVISYQGGETLYREIKDSPYRDEQGRVFDVKKAAHNGIGDGSQFPKLSAEKSFAYKPVVSAKEAQAKGPAWLNDVTLYHNRGNSRFEGENSLHGDFVGLDDIFTEHPTVVKGLIEVYANWMKGYGIDGFRIDTMKHANLEFWQAFAPAMREQALQLGRPDFFTFGENMDDRGDTGLLSEFTTSAGIDASLDFGFFSGLRNFVSRGQDAAALARFFTTDDYYTDHDSNAYGLPTFVSNHDAGRFAYFLKQDNPEASEAQLQELVLLGHGLILTARGQPVLYYGDEQGMVGTGNDQRAREDMFPAKADHFKALSLLGTTRTGADDKFDEQHRFYRVISELAALRRGHPALAQGAMIPRATGQSALFAFSRIERGERIEYLAAFNRSLTETVQATVQTSQPGACVLQPLFDSRSGVRGKGSALNTDTSGAVVLKLAPLQFAVWRAEAPLPARSQPPVVSLATPMNDTQLAIGTHEVDGMVLPLRQELRAEVDGGDGFAEVTFVLQRSSRPGEYQFLGTDDAAPYRVFWRPPADLQPGETMDFIATVDDLRGHKSSAKVERIRVAPGAPECGIKGASVPRLVEQPAAKLSVRTDDRLSLSVKVEGTAPFEYQWLHNGTQIKGANQAKLTVDKMDAAKAGVYAVLVHNREGSTLSSGTQVTVE